MHITLKRRVRAFVSAVPFENWNANENVFLQFEIWKSKQEYSLMDESLPMYVHEWYNF